MKKELSIKEMQRKIQTLSKKVKTLHKENESEYNKDSSQYCSPREYVTLFGGELNNVYKEYYAGEISGCKIGGRIWLKIPKKPGIDIETNKDERVEYEKALAEFINTEDGDLIGRYLGEIIEAQSKVGEHNKKLFAKHGFDMKSPGAFALISVPDEKLEALAKFTKENDINFWVVDNHIVIEKTNTLEGAAVEYGCDSKDMAKEIINDFFNGTDNVLNRMKGSLQNIACFDKTNEETEHFFSCLKSMYLRYVSEEEYDNLCLPEIKDLLLDFIGDELEEEILTPEKGFGGYRRMALGIQAIEGKMYRERLARGEF